MTHRSYPLLASIENPLQLQACEIAQLERLAEQARAFLIESISRTGGHLGAALGVVELTLALFHEFDFLQDRIAWDVGHQAHAYKLFTGRMADFGRYGEWNGLCKFLERRESPYDHMGAGHASTSVSAALGMAIARDVQGERHHVLAVIGDGALTGGLAYEALGMAGALDLNLLVVFNDNGMSIDPNVGAFARTVARIAASDSYNAFRDEVKKVTEHVPFGGGILRGLKHMERSVKDYASPNAAFFESLGFRYVGPVPGHRMAELVSMLRHVKTMRGPVLLHVKTVKGKGLGPEVENTFEAHAVSPRAPAAGAAPSASAPPVVSWTKVYTQGMQEIMARDPKVVALTAAMLSNTGLAPLKERYPDRVFDVGIAEANAYCSAAGMAVGGLKPFVTVYSTFSQRAFDQMVHDIALQKLPVRMMMDRGGFVGSDGPTHHGVFDFSYLRLIPNLVHMAPRDEREMRRMMLTALAYGEGPIALRYPRGDTAKMTWTGDLAPIPVGEGELLLDAPEPRLALVAIGSMVAPARRVAERLAAEGIPCTLIDARFVKPLDAALLCTQIARAKGVVTIEENVVAGGLGEAVLELMAREGLLRPTLVLGIPDRFISFGSQQEQFREAGLSEEQLLDRTREHARALAGKTSRRYRRTA
ncbi:MAG: 1-deoxy-D-xylulose-5-phosphate synthase [Candidatus Lambdaproteobacteria bacterium]|nr:1-deoxy-D-xylulose-5-phosphate synthase [Candidatus Lambdaproteobacteria bacterium]